MAQAHGSGAWDAGQNPLHRGSSVIMGRKLPQAEVGVKRWGRASLEAMSIVLARGQRLGEVDQGRADRPGQQRRQDGGDLRQLLGDLQRQAVIL